jgi:hypothetical protein
MAQDGNTNPYVVVGSPNYATPVLNMFGDKSPTQGQQANQQNRPGQPNQPSFMQQLWKYLQGGPPQQTNPTGPTYTPRGPMNITPDQTQIAGNPTMGNLY